MIHEHILQCNMNFLGFDVAGRRRTISINLDYHFF